MAPTASQALPPPGAGLPAPTLRLPAWIWLAWALGAVLFTAMRYDTVVGLALADTDDALRLVQVRDLVAGQGWFDPMQYRMNPPDGVRMHWSRLPDAALAAHVLTLRPLLGTAAAERVAITVWPLALLLAYIALLAHIGRQAAGEAAGLVALFLGLLAIPVVAQMLPGRIDHHGLQIVLALALLACLSAPRPGRRTAAAAGTVSALMLAIGLETLPYIVAAQLALGWRWAVAPRESARFVNVYGLSLAGTSALVFLATVAPESWARPDCDAFSIVYLAAAATAAPVWSAAAALGTRLAGTGIRLLCLAFAAIGAAAGLLALFPDCLAGPYGAVDPRLKSLWLAQVREAQPALALAGKSPGLVLALFGFPVIATAGLVMAWRRGDERQRWIVAGLFLCAALLTGLWQVRAASFANAFAVIPTACLVVTLLARVQAMGGAVRRGVASATILALANGLMFELVGDAVSVTLEQDGEGVPAGCPAAEGLAALASLPSGRVLAPIDMGPAILLHTKHAVLAAPYHRNRDGLGAALEIWLGAPEEARRTLRQRAVDYVVFCPGQPEIGLSRSQAPNGFLAGLAGGTTPDWLMPLPLAADELLTIFDVGPRAREDRYR